jgi:hypothetical protein
MQVNGFVQNCRKKNGLTALVKVANLATRGAQLLQIGPSFAQSPSQQEIL